MSYSSTQDRELCLLSVSLFLVPLPSCCLQLSSKDHEPRFIFYESGIVRGIDTLKGLLYVITPVPPQILEDVDLLLQGFIQIPTALLQVYNMPWKKKVFFC